jgi:hypothetical protein
MSSVGMSALSTASSWAAFVGDLGGRRIVDCRADQFATAGWHRLIAASHHPQSMPSSSYPAHDRGTLAMISYLGSGDVGQNRRARSWDVTHAQSTGALPATFGLPGRVALQRPRSPTSRASESRWSQSRPSPSPRLQRRRPRAAPQTGGDYTTRQAAYDLRKLAANSSLSKCSSAVTRSVVHEEALLPDSGN